MSDVSTTMPAAVRRLDTPAALAVADLTAIFDDLEAVLRCCERLMSCLDAPEPLDDLALEAFWTTAVLSYARCFATRARDTGLTTDDVAATGLEGDVLGWHGVLLQLRGHQADPVVNPRERFSVGVSQGDDGAASGIAVTSTRQPPVDDVTVRQTGAVAYALSRLVDGRITERQQAVSDAARTMPRTELDALPRLDITSEA